MEQMILTAPAIADELSIDAIARAVRAVEGVASVTGSAETKQVAVGFDPATTSLDAIKAAMAAAGFPVAANWSALPMAASGDGQAMAKPERPTFAVRLLRDGQTAEVGYACSCGCKPKARYVQGSATSGSEHCCCGLAHFAGADAMVQLQAYLSARRERGEDADRTYELNADEVEAPWGGRLQVAFALPV